MEMKVNLELVLAFYKQRVAELEHDLIIQKAVNETLLAALQEIQNGHEHDHKQEE
jgi:hypothetical protein